MMINSRQTLLDEYMPYICSRCGAKFDTLNGLKIHMSYHIKQDRMTIIKTFENIRTIPYIYKPHQLKAILKAIISNNKDDALEILSLHEDLKDLTDAIRFSYNAWEENKNDFLKHVLSKEDILEILNSFEKQINNKNTLYII